MFIFLFLFFSMLLLCSFFRLKELFQVKNGVIASLLFFFVFFFEKMPKIWVGRTMVNGEKKENGLIFTFFIVFFGVEMREQSVKLSRLIIFYFISNFLIYAPVLPNRSRKPVLFAVFSFLEQFFSSSTVVSVAKANVLQTPTIAVFARNWSGADPNFAPFRWRI